MLMIVADAFHFSCWRSHRAIYKSDYDVIDGRRAGEMPPRIADIFAYTTLIACWRAHFFVYRAAMGIYVAGAATINTMMRPI